MHLQKYLAKKQLVVVNLESSSLLLKLNKLCSFHKKSVDFIFWANWLEMKVWLKNFLTNLSRHLSKKVKSLHYKMWHYPISQHSSWSIRTEKKNADSWMGWQEVFNIYLWKMQFKKDLIFFQKAAVKDSVCQLSNVKIDSF